MDSKSKDLSNQMYEYIYNNKSYPLKNHYFKFLYLKFEDNTNLTNVFDFLKELIKDSVLLKIDNDYIIFYFTDLDFEIKDIVKSISDDFGLSIFLYSSGRISNEFPEHFRILYEYVKKYFSSTSLNYVTNSDLILEITKTNLFELRYLKAPILNRINGDSQIEKLILSMFDSNLNVTKAAKDTYMHRNTVIYKLDYIKQETGLNLQVFLDATCMYLLLKAK